MAYYKFIICVCLVLSVQGAPSLWKKSSPSSSEEHGLRLGDVFKVDFPMSWEKIVKPDEFLDTNVKKNLMTEYAKLKTLVDAIISLVHEGNLDNTTEITSPSDLSEKRGIASDATTENFKITADSTPTDFPPAVLTPEQPVAAEPETVEDTVTPAMVEAGIIVSGEALSQQQPPQGVDLHPTQRQATLIIDDENVADSKDTTVEPSTVEVPTDGTPSQQLTPAEPPSEITPAVVEEDTFGVDNSKASSKSQTAKEDNSSHAGLDAATSVVNEHAAVTGAISSDSASSDVVPNKSATVESVSAESKLVQSEAARTVADVDPAVSVNALYESAPWDDVSTESAFVQSGESSSVSREDVLIEAEYSSERSDVDSITDESLPKLEDLYPVVGEDFSKLGADFISRNNDIPLIQLPEAGAHSRGWSDSHLHRSLIAI